VQTEFSRPLAVEAGAGTGKTTVLVARIVAWAMGPGWERAEARLREEARSRGAIANPARERVAGEVLRRVVAITFTEAAAAEMAARVAEALIATRQGDELPTGIESGVLPADGPECAARARALVGGLDQLVVRTIHAYCRRLLVTHSLEAGLHPRFEVDADEHLLEEIAREVVESSLVEAYGEPADEDHLALSSRNLGPSFLEKALLALLRQAVPPEALLEDPLTPERVGTFRGFLERHLAELRRIEGGRLASLKGASRAVETSEAVAATAEALRTRRSDPREDLREILGVIEKHWTRQNLAKLSDWEKGRFGVKEREALGESAELLPARAAKLHRALRGAAALDLDLLDLARRVLQPLLAEATLLLRRRGVESYTALLRDARDLLVRSPHAARRIRQEIDQLLVDEFQDTDRTQCEILRVLALEGEESERPGLLLVGDPKQSIYGWRSADLRAYHGFLGELRARGGACERLSVNFRSAPAILDEVRRVVEPVMQAREGLQPSFEPLTPCPQKEGATGFRSPGFAPLEHWISWTWDSGGEAPLTKPRARDSAELEAGALARDLLRLHREHGVPWREIGLLFRSSSDFETYLGALREAQVPYVVERDRSYYRRREIIEASALVRSVLDPCDHLALVTLLRSALVGAPDAALIPLWRKGFPDRMAELPDPRALAALRDATLEVASSLPAEIPGLERIRGWEQNLLSAVEGLALLRRSLLADPADRFVEKLRTLFLVEATESARFLGAHRVANLDRFFRDLVTALEESGGDLCALLAKLRAAVSEALEEEEGRPKDAAENAVQVMTVHKAKGLDFEHVYLMQLHKGHRRAAAMESAAVERDGGWEYLLFGAATPGYLEAASEAAEVEAAERVRTLYVAMTRAKDRLVLVGCHPTRPPALDSAATHADLISHRSPSPPDLSSLMSELRARGDAAYAEGADVRWVFPALLGEDPAPSAPARDESEVSGPSVEEIRASAEKLSERRREAALRAARPFHGVASEEVHAMGPEQAWPHGDGEEDENGSLASPDAAPIEPERRVALAVGSALHSALEILDPAAEPEGEIERCRSRIEAVLAVLLGPEDRPEALSRAGELWTRFARGPLLERLRAIGPSVIARELPLLLPPGQAPHAPVGFVSGAIDLLYRDPESGAIVVADYKTDRVESPSEIRERAGSYAAQGGIYLQGIRESLDLEGDLRFELWFLHPGCIEVVPLPKAR
jgi:ATP-dependent helicase/nuclease subunit A